jgi:metal-responsive CopG/Arc/MetJ family transcriptional regulator
MEENMEEYKKVTISFTKEQLEKLDEIMSKEQGYTRSSLVREAVDYYLGYLAQKGNVSYLSPIISQNIKSAVVSKTFLDAAILRLHHLPNTT